MKTVIVFFLSCLAAVVAKETAAESHGVVAETPAVRNSGFEDGLAGWDGGASMVLDGIDWKHTPRNGCFQGRKRAFLRSPL